MRKKPPRFWLSIELGFDVTTHYENLIFINHQLLRSIYSTPYNTLNDLHTLAI